MHKIAVIGLGTMGSGIAQVAAMSGFEVLVFDSHTPMMERCKSDLKKFLETQILKSKMTSEEGQNILSRFHWCSQLDQIFQAELVIEAVREDADIKKELFHQISKVVSDQCIIATNTSSISITSLATSVSLPGRFIGVHFFNPAPLMPLVEIIPALQTEAQTISRTISIVQKFGKLGITAKDTPGFLVNRIARPYYGEAIRILEEGIADISTIDWAMTQMGGFKMGPFTLMDFIGHDVNYQVTEIVFKAFYFDARYKPSFTQKRLVEAGFLGRKSGRGFYDYSGGFVAPEPVKNAEIGQMILNRILAMLINEAAEALYYNIASKEDIDLAMTKGVNYPKGLLKWADDLGISTLVNQLDSLFEQYREDRYRCSLLLRKMAASNQKFF
ncbi:MAG: 3-hydroxybutyryl-CoA dehydrogenase [Saprospiraceae bacterium]|nr:3-hydroxybutyryl-CoA dehydrogenase [Saprospiraceae bacterium]